MKTIKVEIELLVGDLKDLGLSLGQSIGNFTEDGKKVGEINMTISGEYYGFVKNGKDNLHFRTKAVDAINKALTKEINQ